MMQRDHPWLFVLLVTLAVIVLTGTLIQVIGVFTDA